MYITIDVHPWICINGHPHGYPCVFLDTQTLIYTWVSISYIDNWTWIPMCLRMDIHIYVMDIPLNIHGWSSIYRELDVDDHG